MRPTTPLGELHGVGPKRAEALARAGYRNVEDLLYYFPVRYDDRRAFAEIADLRPGPAPRTIAVTVDSARLLRTRRRGFTIFRAQVHDDSGSIEVVCYNQPYLTRVYTPGKSLLLFGRTIVDRSGRMILDNPEYETVSADAESGGVHGGRIVPVYRKLADLTPRMLRRAIYSILDQLPADCLRDRLPPEVRRRQKFPPRQGALQKVHFPDPDTDVEVLERRETVEQQALAFEEIFLLQLAWALRRHGLRKQERGIAYRLTDALRIRLAELLPFKLTGAQKRVLKEIGDDLRSGHPMHRLLQGDVGSGKTIVAFLSMLVAVDNGYQAALMAPTGILAIQHARGLEKLFRESGAEQPATVLLTGSLKAKARREALGKVESGEARLVVGTHALFESAVEFHRLGFVVVDEQHRFGVLQRAALSSKGARPDVLVMTATPIPRSLSMTMYGDLDLSVIDERPPGRQPIRTVVRQEGARSKVYEGLRKEVARGRQAYVVTPLVEETEKSDLKAATEFAGKLSREVLPDLQVGLLHGKMKAADKAEVMDRFVAGELQVLVATTVIEVGVDVPNATVMIVEHAERFGLSQLHQLRGRVGRGSDASYCVLMCGAEATSQEAGERLAVMEQTDDGFRIAEKDMELRGPGSIFGTAQHGLGDLQFLPWVLQNAELLSSAREEAGRYVDADPESRKQAAALLRSLGGRWKIRLDLARIG